MPLLRNDSPGSRGLGERAFPNYSQHVRRVGALVLVLAAAGGAAALSGAARSPKALRASILAAARAKHSVHYTTTGGRGHVRERIVADVAADRGIQRIAFTKSGRTGHVTVKVVNRTAYIRGDAFTLHNYMDFPTALASRYAGRWIALLHTNRAYATVAAAVTFSSFLDELQPKGKAVRIVSGAIGGKRVVGVRSSSDQHGVRLVSTLFARPGADPLPVEERDTVPGKNASSVATMSRWNERVRVKAPARAKVVG